MPRGVPNSKNDAFEDDFNTTVGAGDGFDSMPESDEMPTEEASRPNWLKPNHVGRQTAGTFEVVKVLPNNTQFSDVVLLVKLKGGELYQLGLKLFSDDYKSLKKKFGGKRQDWHGEVRYKVIANNGKPYVAVRG